jgi:tRNA(fMet)-specific endonuclease VapC
VAARYLLDTNILSDLIKHPGGHVAARISHFSPDELQEVATSIIVAAEVRYGVAKKGSRILDARIEQLFQVMPVLPFAADADKQYGRLRAELERQGQVIGANDMLIAAHALAIGAVLVTDNVREFERISSLTVENWLL